MTLAPVADDLPSVFHTPTRHDTDSWVSVVGDVVRLAQQISSTDFVPKGLRNNVPATAAAMLYGREVGLPPMTALTSIHVVDGRPGMSAEGMRSLVFAAGHELVFDEATGSLCRMRARRRGSNEWTSLAWSLDMGRAAGLLGRDNWKKYPRAMLIARCTTDLCRMVFPDVIHGFRSIEEIGDMGDLIDPTGDDAPVAPKRGRSTVSRRPRAIETAELPPEGSRTATDREEAAPPSEISDPSVDAASSGDGGEVETAPSPDPAPDDVPIPEVVEETTAKPTAVDQDETTEPGERRVNRSSVRMILRQFDRLGLGDDRDERLAITTGIVGREVTTTNDLTVEEAGKVLTAVGSCRDATELRNVLSIADDNPNAWDELATIIDRERGES